VVKQYQRHEKSQEDKIKSSVFTLVGSRQGKHPRSILKGPGGVSIDRGRKGVACWDGRENRRLKKEGFEDLSSGFG